MKVLGYSDVLSARPGETIKFMVSCDLPTYRANVVRLIHADANPKGPGFKEEEIDVSINGCYQGHKYAINSGSYVLVPESVHLGTQSGFTVQCWIYPTTPMKPSQGIFTNWCVATQTGYGLIISDNGNLSIWMKGKDTGRIEVSTGIGLREHSWYFVSASYDINDKKVILVQSAVPEWPNNPQVVVDQEIEKTIIFSNKGAVSIGCYFSSDRSSSGSMLGFFNGKIEGPRLFNRGLGREEIISLASTSFANKHSQDLVASWDFSKDIGKSLVSDLSSNQLHGYTINMPTRGVTGHNWTGKETDFRRVPDEYAAIHFHDDDLDDAGWPVGFEYKIPSEMKSGVYAAKLITGKATDYLPFFVKPRSKESTARIAFLAPTLTYTAYANKQLNIDRSNRIYSDLPLDFEYPSQKEDKFIVENGLIGTYDRHTDGSGVCYSSRLRPMLNFRPSYNFPPLANGRGSPHLLSADLHLLDWMEHEGHSFDVIVDEDLHNEGASLLRPYKAIVSGTHPEYWSMSMLDGMEEYLFEGGRLAYLGGNGFYWVTSVEKELGHTVEVRRWGGTQTWEAAPGEYHHSTTGELGGLWRNRGRAPQKLVGVGMPSQGYDRNAPYYRSRDSFDPRAKFIFEGISRDEAIGDFQSLVMEHGAAGFEIDRADSSLGTPEHAFIVATATEYSDSYQHVIEEVYESDSRQGASVNSKVKSDMVYLLYPNHGAVFSVGSISWCSCLSYNQYENAISRITSNVLNQFSTAEHL